MSSSSSHGSRVSGSGKVFRKRLGELRVTNESAARTPCPSAAPSEVGCVEDSASDLLAMDDGMKKGTRLKSLSSLAAASLELEAHQD
jgi:hypothetical protein